MYKFIVDTNYPLHLFKELIDVFLNPDDYLCVGSDDPISNEVDKDSQRTTMFRYSGKGSVDERNAIKRKIFDDLVKITGKTPEWGILTGIRPVKLAGEIIEQGMTPEETVSYLKKRYLISHRKALLVTDMYLYQMKEVGKPEERERGLYIGIPFCPTRCLYCSFPSNLGSDEEIQWYLTALKKEISYVSVEMNQKGQYPESIYIGGGTPTTFSAEQLKELLELCQQSFDFSRCREITVEAGRPDTITKEKLMVLKEYGVSRISINPQTMKDETLKIIGRDHTSQQVREAFDCAREIGFPIINADLIAGLPGETFEDFNRTLEEIDLLKPENITIHTLAVKRASRLIETDKNFHYKQAALVTEMLQASTKFLKERGYRPYYLYRQKHMAGALENMGFSKIGTENIYNIRMMDEHQTIIAVGAGAISKVYYPLENRLERVPNVSNYQLYVQRVDEMIERKKKHIFQEV